MKTSSSIRRLVPAITLAICVLQLIPNTEAVASSWALPAQPVTDLNTDVFVNRDFVSTSVTRNTFQNFENHDPQFLDFLRVNGLSSYWTCVIDGQFIEERYTEPGLPTNSRCMDVVMKERSQETTQKWTKVIQIKKGGLQVQPPGGTAALQYPVIFYVKNTKQEFRADVSGEKVSIKAYANRFHYDFGDGTTVDTDEPGRPYPKQTLTHTYVKPGDYRVKLRIEWVVKYRQPGDANYRIAPQRAETTEEYGPISVRKVLAVLTDDAEEANGH